MAEESSKKKPIQFLKDVAAEMKRVTWPTRRELSRYTVVVVLTVAFIAVFFAISDLGISTVIDLITN
ncbi:preprotein translocase subunit SecE [Salisediminibacterium halotolerans]|uniref:Protein translocase subunit SecE n=1 Tax=Salisediminibacterium halotolerans TaxID=517425 RepID=A0A1H9UQZ5_9BACI|nr:MULTISPECIES: preprotein translocase subunit SecE [Salisediminibacterium]RLJ73061.1 preprotein translocase subunit SecE [Actinophytocola xinjiangensis]RPE86483.1 preprotein translocase subunit SecE [Salisediminibacterium halotolerans]TWG33858.1 preprotein translocase subunit SecE [Salisediminibacterium halotolerans]SES11778.1 preprotein translocase subunit SecE [Salisediminibacterium haloalkalitolerans]GEL07483.1 hypothetical protein SHA02_08990 [Salisediminibacterium halotolerans]